jgi:6-phosphogluconolactonase
MKNHYGSLLALTCVSMLSCTPLRSITGPSPAAYVANYDSGDISGYSINRTTGALTPIAGSPFPAGGISPSSVAVAPSGKFAYVTNLANGKVSGYTIDPTGALTPIAGSPFPAGGFGPLSVAVDRSGKFAYVTNYVTEHKNVSGYKIDPTTGALTPIGSFAAGGRPNFVAVTPSPRFVISPWFSRFSHWFLFKLRPTIR